MPFLIEPDRLGAARFIVFDLLDRRIKTTTRETDLHRASARAALAERRTREFCEREWKKRGTTWESGSSTLVDDPSKKLQYPGLIAKGYVPLLP